MPHWLPMVFAAPASGALMAMLLQHKRRWQSLGGFRVWPLFAAVCLLPVAALGGQGARDAVFVYLWLVAIGLFVDAARLGIRWLRKGAFSQRAALLFDVSVLVAMYLALVVREFAAGGFACEPYQHPFPRALPEGLETPRCRWPLSDRNHSRVGVELIRLAAHRYPESPIGPDTNLQSAASDELAVTIHGSAADCREAGFGAYVASGGDGSPPELVLCEEACRQHYHSVTVMVRHRCELWDDTALASAPMRAEAK